MKQKANALLDWFEDHFNFYIELLAFGGGIFSIVFSIVLFVILLIDANRIEDTPMFLVLLPGFIGFFGVMILFALRVTRHITHQPKK